MGKTIITGGAGFVGSNLARLIKSSILLDWRNPGYLFENETNQLVFDDCEFVHGDIRNSDDLEKCLEFGEIDSIIHLASIPGIKKCKKDPKLAKSVNIDGTENVLDFARKNDVKDVIFASSAGVYGEIVEHPITEDHPKDPLNLYSETKRKGEKLCREYAEKYDLDTTVMRMSNLYGPGFQTKPNLTVIPLFVLKALQNQPLTIYGDGEQTRDFVHVEDVAQGYRKTFENQSSGFGVYNLGSGVTTSMNQLADIIVDLVEKLYDRQTETKHVEPPEWRDEAREKFDYSIKNIEDDLGYEPEFDLEKGIRELFKSF
ncbi:hypothetical protein AKJ52_00755 [candidate division MSBL1 archaeon SCGC-AAA382C18]|uniref:NAD-dependent epimerase/dehydratase domain-containing protein n=1 Tax=candidate division MSBL1 archaeon SCGC-AAA382C18 TaxID=1698281 RepID=A0A133VL94_9EURY|nr:hypothetical protein AKJ52_00755 [candidate division MSBL1 archaeon SCGC-AAA382C18]